MADILNHENWTLNNIRGDFLKIFYTTEAHKLSVI